MRTTLKRVPEKAIQRDIVRLLRSVGGVVFVIGTRRAKGDYQGTRMSPGLPDLITVVAAELVMIEVKARNGQLRPAQKIFRDACIDAGVRHIVGGLDEVLAYLEARGLARRSA